MSKRKSNEQAIELNDFQQQVLKIPEQIDLFLGGGRGGGKSYCLALLALRHAAQYGKSARILYIRKSYKGLADFELLTRELFGTIYGTDARYNAAEHVWRFPNGAYIELGQLESASDYVKYQGRSFTLLIVDEAGQYSDPYLLDMLRSNMRGPKDMAIRMIIAANPAGVGHQWLAARYVFNGTSPWQVFTEKKSKRLFVHCPSVFAGNSFIDRDQYLEQLQSSCPDDPELLRAWIAGDWAVNRGAALAGVLEEARNALPAWGFDDLPSGLFEDHYLSHDWGSSAPSVSLLCGVSAGGVAPDGRWLPRGSLAVLDEVATVRPGSLNHGLGLTVPEVALRIKAMCDRWHIRASGIADDACFSKQGHSVGSIADEFRKSGVHFSQAHKGDRLSGLQVMRRMLADAGKLDKPGLYISRLCEYTWATLPYIGRDERKPEDVDTSSPDHAYDALRYALRRKEWAKNIGVRWQY